MDRVLLDRLLEHQREVEAIMGRALPLLRPDAPPDPAALARLRWEVTRALTGYQQFKHRSIFDPAIARGLPQLRSMGEAVKADCVAVGDEFSAYVRHWTARGTAEHWAEYRAAARAMIDRLRRHMARERQTVASLLLRAAPTGGTPGRAGRP